MSQKYTGGFITKSPVAPTTSAASGIWTLDQQQQAQKAGTWPSPPIFIEDLFSTYLYTGNGTSQTITNGIDLSTKGGLVWLKWREGGGNHQLQDTVRGATNLISSNTTDAQATDAQALNAFTSSGFTVGSLGATNGSGRLFASWTFREQPKFFDIVTYTGDGTDNRAIAHNLGSVPGCIIVKSISLGLGWPTYHRGMATSNPESWEMYLNTTAARTVNGTWGGAPTSTNFYVNNLAAVNQGGDTYVAYLFAHDAGGFPVSGGGSTNGISCGSFTTDGSGNATVSLGYEPQWVISKRSSGVAGWEMFDNMRGMTVAGLDDALLYANSSDAEVQGTNLIAPNATGFSVANEFTSSTYIYIAIRRGPMKTPTVGTSVFTPILTGSSASNLTDTYSSIGFPIDMTLRYQTGTDTSGTLKNAVYTRLLGLNSGAGQTPVSANNPNLLTHSTAAQDTTYYLSQDGSMGMNYGGSWSAPAYVLTHLHFKRAPSFMDVVCYTGTGSATTFTHNLGVVPELMIVKRRNTTGYWLVYSATIGATKALYLNDTSSAVTDSAYWNDTSPTSTVFTVKTDGM